MDVASASPPAPVAAPPEAVRGSAILAAVKSAGVEFMVTVPDITTSESLLRQIARGQDFRHVRICKEDEGVAICAGLSFCRKRAVLMIQSTGLLDSMNAVKAVAFEYQLPICMLVGLIGKEVGRAPQQSADAGVRVIEPILDTFPIEHHLIETDSDVGVIAPAIERAYSRSRPVALLIGRPPRPL